MVLYRFGHVPNRIHSKQMKSDKCFRFQQMYYTESFHHLNEKKKKKTRRKEVEEMEWNGMNCINRKEKQIKTQTKSDL